MATTGATYFEHEADVGIVGLGESLDEAFEQAARATFGVMADVDAIVPERTIRVAFDEDDPELALVTWLNQLITTARIEGIVLGQFRLRHDGGHWDGEAWGQPWREDLERGVEVKGATLTALSVRPLDGAWEARCVVDV